MLTQDRRTARLTTPGATATVAAAIDPAAGRPEGVDGDYQGQLDVRICSRSATGSGFYHKRVNVRRVSGVVSIASTSDVATSFVEVALTGVLVDFLVSAANVQVRVTGLAATNVTWDVDVESRIYHS